MPQRLCATDTTPSEAARELLAIRQHLGLTQRAFARMLGAGARSLCRWELGQRPTPQSILQLSRFYALWTQPPNRFFPDPATLTMTIQASVCCHWATAGPCHGHRFLISARISRRREITTETCEAHWPQAVQTIDFIHRHKGTPLRRLLGRVESSKGRL